MLKLRQVHNHERHCGVRRDRSSDKICRALTTGPGAGAGKCRVMIRAQPRGGTDNIARSPLMRAPERVGDESGRSSRQADRRTAVHFRNAADDRQCGIRCNRHADLICSHGGITRGHWRSGWRRCRRGGRRCRCRRSRCSLAGRKQLLSCSEFACSARGKGRSNRGQHGCRQEVAARQVARLAINENWQSARTVTALARRR